jgi:transcription elongation factor GreA
VLKARLEAARAAPDPEDPTQAPALWALFQSLGTAREQETCVPLLAEVFGEEAWLDEAVKNLAHAPSGMIRQLCDELIAKRPKELMQVYHDLLARPLRSPEVLIALARLVEAGKLKGDLPSELQRAQSLLALATFLYVNRRSDPVLTRAQTRLTEFLSGGSEPVLRRLLENADYAALKSIQRSLQRGVDEGIDNLVTDMVMHSTPEGELKRAAWFWENDSIWTTLKGREKRVAELKHLVEVLIPKNEEALGRAAAMGDLSENFEWTSAIEEQRNLGDKRSQLENEISRAEMIENAPMPEDVVCPGTRVRYKDLLDSTQHTIVILGPWDTEDSDDVVSYRAPLAWGLLGKAVGEGAIIQLPSGEIELEVVEIQTLDLG